MEDAKERLFKAAVVGDTEVLWQLAAEHPADADEIFSKRNDQGDLASHVALQHGHHEFAMMICSSFPAALWELNGKGDGLLHMAAKLGHHEFFLKGARLLLRHFSSYDDEHDERRRDAMKFTNSAVNREGKSLLYVAADKGYLQAAKLLLENRVYCADMDRAFMGPNGSTALHIATRNRNYDMVRIFLISHPSSVYIRDRDGFSSIDLAIRLNETEMFQLLLRHCPLTDKGQNALHIAVEGNNENLVSVIVKDRRLSELMINQQDENGNTPLHLAAYRGDKKMQDTLLSCQAKVKPLRNKAGLTFEEVAKLKVIERLFKAAVVGDTVVLGQLADEHPADVIFSIRNDDGDLSSHVALQYGRHEFVLKICSYHLPALWEHNGKGDGLLHMAAKLGHHQFFLKGAILLYQHFQGFSSYAVEHDERRRDAMKFTNSAVNGEGKSLLYVAAEKGYLQAAKLLLENRAYFQYDGAFHGPDGSTALHVATRNKDYDMVQIFMQHGVPDSIITRQEVETGYTPLHIAVSLNKPRLAELFLTSHPSSADILDRDGFSPFHFAVHLNKTEMLELFLRHRPDCCNNKTLTDKGQNALHIAVEKNIEGLISVIVTNRRLSELMVNQQDEDGNTPLHIAAYRDDKKMQDTLLDCQAKVLPLKNKAGLTFQDVAKSVKRKRKFVDGMKEFQSGLLIMTTLIITVTFTASFTLPGGYNGNQPNQGMATLVGLTGFDVFLVTNTISMSSAIIAAASLILFPVVATENQFITMKVAVGAIVVSILLMLAAVTAGVWVVIGSQRKWLAIFISVITSFTPLCLAILAMKVMPASENLIVKISPPGIIRQVSEVRYPEKIQ